VAFRRFHHNGLRAMRSACKKRLYSFRNMLLFSMAAFLLLSLCLDEAGLTSRAQKKTRPTQEKSARPKPTPTPSAVDGLGTPPPVPTLKRPPDQEVTPGDVISVMTTEVLLPVTVRDSSGRLVKDLTRNDFRVFEDNREQPVNDLALREVPVDAVLMVDASSSVATNIDDFRRAAEGFAARLNADDRISLIKFDDHVELLQDWTRSRFQLRRALARIEPGMFTRFNDALLLASREQFGETKSRRAVIVLTDGIDSGRGTTTLAGALEALLRSQVTIYVVSNTEISRAAKRAELDNLLTGSSSTVRFNQLRIDDLKEGLRVLDQSEKNLEDLATATGGRLYKPLTFQALDSTYAEVADELRYQYGLYYPPLNKSRDGAFRQVRVQLTNPSYKAHTRVGYFAPAR
jgi:Ca-activated chloride channel family protein